jgi:hypothetical protein
MTMTIAFLAELLIPLLTLTFIICAKMCALYELCLLHFMHSLLVDCVAPQEDGLQGEGKVCSLIPPFLAERCCSQ